MSQDLPGDTFVGPRFGMWRPTQCVRHGQADEGRRSHQRDIAKYLGVSRATLYRYLTEDTLGWGPLAQHTRLHGYLDDVPPAEFEEAFYATKRTDQPPVEIQ